MGKPKHLKPRYLMGKEAHLPNHRETVEEYLARGGEIKRCLAPWDPNYVQPDKKPDKSTWGRSGDYGT